MSLRRPRPIRPSDDSSSFDCGEQLLDRWIQLRALRNEADRASRTFVTIDDEVDLVAGYYCLSAGSLRHEDAPGKLRRNMPDPIPTVLIGRLAVDRRYQGRGVGASLIQDAALKSVDASRLVGARAILVDALSEEVVAFYQRWGFTLMPESQRALYLLIGDAEETIRSLTES